MTGKISNAEKNLKAGNNNNNNSSSGCKLNSNMVKISSSKSILSYQNGSALLSVESRECGVRMPAEGYEDGDEDGGPAGGPGPFGAPDTVSGECLDLLRKKLISDSSLTVFSCDLENKLTKMEPIRVSKERQSVVQKLVVQISQLSDAEKLLLYLKLPSSTSSPFDPLRQPLNPLGNRQEIQQTIVWIKTHLEEDSKMSIPKQDVYDQYLKYCENVSMKPLSTADFGKVMKQVYPGVRPRRLGTRGNSRYCYSGMRNTCKLPTPILPQSTVENTVSNGSSNDGLSFLPPDGGKYKKAKRKLASSPTCRGDGKFTAITRSTSRDVENVPDTRSKGTKRSKSDGDVECVREGDQVKDEEANTAKIKCEDCTVNTFSAFDVDCELPNDFGLYIKEEGNEGGGDSTSLSSSTKSHTGTSKASDERGAEEKENGYQEDKAQENLENLRRSPGDQTNGSGDTLNDLDGEKEAVTDKAAVGSRARVRRSSSASRTGKTLKKSYVPIQPKPEDPSKGPRPFETGRQMFPEGKPDPDALTLCEESDSQEPEEEIVRYFKHLNEADMTANGLVDEAVKFIENAPVTANSSIQEMVTRTSMAYGGGGLGREDVGMGQQSSQQLLRSQSCFEGHRDVFGVTEKVDPVYMPRSQSSVELATSNRSGVRVTDGTDTDPAKSESSAKKKKVSHLRILLEKSISSDVKNAYPSPVGPKRDGTTAPNPAADAGGPVLPPGPNNESMYHMPSNVKLGVTERDLLKLNGLKVVPRGPSLVPQSPNTRTKYFSFTPISPGPQSPHKTPTVSPFVSPRNTPVPRSVKQAVHGDHFLSPFDRKSGSIRSDGPKGDYINESAVFNFAKCLAGSPRLKSCMSPTVPDHGPRPRSYSSASFYRSRAKRNAAKSGTFDPVNAMASLGKAQAVPAAQAVGSPYPMTGPFGPAMGPGFASNETLSTEVQKLLESESRTAGTIRSRSVPLNKMISESSWVTGQTYPMYPGFFGSGPGSDESGKVPGLVGHGNGKTPNLTQAFVSTEDLAGLGPGSMGTDMFPGGDPGLVPLGSDKYFVGEFQRSNDDGAFGETVQGFGDDSTFPAKLDLNSGGAFEAAFATDADPAIPDNIKSYLPDFEGLDNKALVEGPATGDDVQPDPKLFKTTLYEPGNDNLKDPVITAFKPVLMNELSGSAGLNFFGPKLNEETQPLIEFFDFEN